MTTAVGLQPDSSAGVAARISGRSRRIGEHQHYPSLNAGILDLIEIHQGLNGRLVAAGDLRECFTTTDPMRPRWIC